MERDAQGGDVATVGSRRYPLNSKQRWTPEQQLADMDSLKVDVQVLSIMPRAYNDQLDVKITTAMAKEYNDEIFQMTKTWPDRFAGFCTLPMQDVPIAINKLERAITQLGLKGAMVGDHVNGRTFDEPEFLPCWQAAEQLGPLIFGIYNVK